MPLERFVLGEYRRTLDDRFRLTVPTELTGFLPQGEDQPCTLAKERPGALSLWLTEQWRQRLAKDVEVIRAKMIAGHLQQRMREVQRLGRLLSTRHREIQVGGRGRVTLPEGFREFLGVEQGGEIVLVGAAVCIEIWHPTAWLDYLNAQMPEFSQLIEELAS